MKENNKKWLISMMKISGSKKRHLVNGSFSDERNSKKNQNIENLPNHESIGNTSNGKLNYAPLLRFLNGQVGNDWDEVYSEIIRRIPTKLFEYKKNVFLFVADKVEIVDGLLYNKKSNAFISIPEPADYHQRLDCSSFYVCPLTNKLLRIEDRPNKKISKTLGKTELRKYREDQKNNKRSYKQGNKAMVIDIIKRFKENNKRKKR